MPKYYGYNSINANKKFSLTDFELIKRDLLNGLLIKQGELPGRPEIGTEIWNYMFDGITDTALQKIEVSMRKQIQRDPRISVQDMRFFSQGNGLLVEIDVQTEVTDSDQMLKLFFDTDTLSASYI